MSGEDARSLDPEFPILAPGGRGAVPQRDRDASSAIGDTMLHDAGIDDTRGPARFRASLARLRIAHFERG